MARQPDCDCCAGVDADTPRRIANPPGLPAIDYRIGRHADFYDSLRARLSSAEYPALAALTSRESSDFTLALGDALACSLDVLGFYTERYAQEHYLRTATEQTLAPAAVNPADYAAIFYAGGHATMWDLADSKGLANIAAQAHGSIEVSDVPVAKDFVKSNDDTRLLRGRYYDMTKEARKASEEFRQAKKAGDSDAMDKILSSPDKEEMIFLSKSILNTNKAAAAIRDEMVDINSRTDLSLAEKRSELKKLERDEAELYRDAIETFR